MTYWIAPLNVMLLNVDLTNDFMPGGALAVDNADDVVPLVNDLRKHFQNIGWTKEEHPAGHAFFASSNPGKKLLDTVQTEFGAQYLWPDHCVTGTAGAEFQQDLIIEPNDLIVIKGTDPTIHAYSAVYMDDRETIITYPDGKTLPQKLRDAQIDTVVVTGVAYDFCPGMTAYDLAKEGFNVILLRDATRDICIQTREGPTTVELMDKMLEDAGVIVTTTDQVQNFIYTEQPRLSA